jgi:hypothetical protein
MHRPIAGTSADQIVCPLVLTASSDWYQLAQACFSNVALSTRESGDRTNHLFRQDRGDHRCVRLGCGVQAGSFCQLLSQRARERPAPKPTALPDRARQSGEIAEQLINTRCTFTGPPTRRELVSAPYIGPFGSSPITRFCMAKSSVLARDVIRCVMLLLSQIGPTTNSNDAQHVSVAMKTVLLRCERLRVSHHCVSPVHCHHANMRGPRAAHARALNALIRGSGSG